MKKILITTFLVVGLLFGMSPASADLLNIPIALPDILSNQTGTYEFTGASDTTPGRILFQARPLTITFDGTDLVPIEATTNKQWSYLAEFLVDINGNFAGGVVDEDVMIQGMFEYMGTTYEGVLLTGEVTNFGFYDVPGPIALFDYTFEVTGGLLAKEFGPVGVDITIAEFSNFLDDWSTEHSGSKVKHDTGPPVPIGSTLALFGSGLAGLMVIRRRFRGE